MGDTAKRCGTCVKWESFWCGVKGVCKQTHTSARAEQSCPHWENAPEDLGATVLKAS